ncbi:MAG: tail fiber domain-containing protein [Phycisphaerales bacterium]|nr:tail fiber domain-containing protein [Phycisphaerales bacterium]
MSMSFSTLRGLVISLCAALLFVPFAAAQSTTAFTYQGSLSSSSAPITGVIDLRAELFSTLTGGSPIAPAVNLTNVTVTNGLFTVPLDFGAAFDDGQPRWVEISVRTPAGAGSFTTLSPRQALTPAPLAQGLAGIAITRGGPESLDQAQDVAGQIVFNVGAISPAWQSWTPSVSGKLTRLQLRVCSALSQTPQTLTVRVYIGVGTNGPLISTFTALLPGNNFSPLQRDLVVPNILVQAGTPYTFDFSGNIVIQEAANSIPGAAGSRAGSGFNYWFRTYVTPASSVDAAAGVAAFANTANTALQLAPGRIRVRGESGTSGGSPGIWFASPVTNPTDRAFVGMRDNDNIGFYNSAWNLLLNANGNVNIGDTSGAAPPERLTVTGNVQINTSANSGRLNFGPIADQGSNAENTDAMYFQRVNVAADSTELRLIIGDNNSTTGTDSFRICTTSTGGGLFERFRFQSDGQALKPGGGSWGVLSDPRAKHDIAPLTGTLDKLMSLRGYSFLYNDDRVASGQALPGTQFGLMADEVARVFPDWVSTDATGTRFVTERATTALMVEALRDLRQEKDRQLEMLKAELTKRDADNAQLKARLEALEAALQKITSESR